MQSDRPALDRRQWLKVTGLALAATVLAPRGRAAPPVPGAVPPAVPPAARRPDREYVHGFEIDPAR